MALLKPFHVQVVTDQTPSATVVEDLGLCVIPILEWKSDVQEANDISDDYLAAFTDDYLYAGGVNLSGNPSLERYPINFANLQEVAPLVVDKNVYRFRGDGNYIRLISDTGYYIITDSTTSVIGGTLYLRSLYDSEGNRLGQNEFYVIRIFNSSNNDSCYCSFFVGNMSGDTITDIKQEIELRGDYGSKTQYTVNCHTRDTDAYHETELWIEWLNACKTQKEEKQQTVTVQWHRPGDGKVLTDTYDIDVAPPSATGGDSGGNTGGNSGGDSGGGTDEGGGGGHAF